MKIKRAASSKTALKYLPRAVRMAAAITARVAGKKALIDGCIVEGKKVGNLRLARSIELPSILTSMAPYGVLSAESPVITRDLFDPAFPVNAVPVPSITPVKRMVATFGTVVPSTPDVVSVGQIMTDSANSPVSYHSAITTNGPDGHALFVTSTPTRYGMPFQYRISDVELFRVLGVSDAEFKAEKYYGENDTNDVYPDHFHPVTLDVEGNPVTFFSFARPTVNVLREYTGSSSRPPIEKTTVCFYLGVLRVDLDELMSDNTQGHGEQGILFGKEIAIEQMLPEWAAIKMIRMSMLQGPGEVQQASYVSSRIISVSDAMTLDGKIVLAIDFKTEVTEEARGDDGFLQSVTPAYVVAAGKLVLDAKTLAPESLEFYDVHALQRDFELASGLQYYLPVPYVPGSEQKTVKPVIETWLLPDASLVTNGMLFKRPNFLNDTLEADDDISELCVNGVPLFSSADGVGAAFPVSTRFWHANSYWHRRSHGISIDRISESTSVSTWYSPQSEPGFGQQTGVLFTDGNRHVSFPLGVTVSHPSQSGAVHFTSDMTLHVQVTCPQKEVRDEQGRLALPSTIIASYWGADGKKYLRVRKGPVWPEDMPEEADEDSFWSQPTEFESETMRVFHYSGNQFTSGKHGHYFG